MQQHGHPPGESLRFPDPRESLVGIAIETRIIAVVIVVDQGVIEI
jgi:hypothetical protein